MGSNLLPKVWQVEITICDMGGHWFVYAGWDCATGATRESAVRSLLHSAGLELVDEVLPGVPRQLQLFDVGVFHVRDERTSKRGGDGAGSGDADHAGTGSGA